MGVKLSEETVLERFHQVHGNKIDYSKFHYVNKRTKGCFICHAKDENGVEHGEFWMLPKNHWEGQGCPKCALEKLKKEPPRRKSLDKFKLELKSVNGNKYVVLSDEYVNTHTKVKLQCNDCGNIFEAIPCDLLHGHGCPICANKKRQAKFLMSYDEMIKMLNEIHDGKYSYEKNDKTKMYSPNDEIIITCQEHGDFIRRINHHKHHGCYDCGMKMFNNARKRSVDDFKIELEEKIGTDIIFNKKDFVDMNVPIKFHCKVCGCDFIRKPTAMLIIKTCPECNKKVYLQARTKTTEQFKAELTELYNGYYILDKTVYTKSDEPCIVTCPEHGDFITTPNAILRGYACPKHFNNKSKQETALTNFISDLIGKENGTSSDRRLLGGYELDYYSELYKTAIEYDGLFWHSDSLKENDYHLMKTNKCENVGVNLFHIFEDEWIEKESIVKNMLALHFNKIDSKIQALDCEINHIKLEDCVDFLNNNNIFGECKANENPHIAFGIYYCGDLVSLIVLSKTENYKFSILRYCMKIGVNIINCFESFVTYVKEHLDIHELTISIDKRFPTNLKLNDIGFELITVTEPTYYNVISNTKYTDDELNDIKIKPNTIIRRIYDCGQEIYTIDFRKKNSILIN